MATEFLIVAMAVAGLLVVVYRTDTSEQIVQPLVDTLELALEYVVDATANRAKLAGKWIVRQAGNLASLAMDFTGATIWTVIVVGVRVGGVGSQFVASSLRQYIPIITAGLKKEVSRTAGFLSRQANKSSHFLVLYTPVAWEWTVKNAKLAGEVTWLMLVKAGTGFKKFFQRNTPT